MTPGMRNLYERCCDNDGGITATFMTQTDKWRLTALKRQGWVVTWPDDEGQVRVRVVRQWPVTGRRRESGATGP